VSARVPDEQTPSVRRALVVAAVVVLAVRHIVPFERAAVVTFDRDFLEGTILAVEKLAVTL